MINIVKTSISHRQRLEICLSNSKADRVPVALWRHFPVDDQDPQRLAKAVINFQNQYDFDLVKVTPASSYCLKDWGVEDEWRGYSEGTREYTKRVIEKPEDWSDLPLLDPYAGSLGDSLKTLWLISNELGEDIPIVQTIFNPLYQAKNLAGQDRLLSHLRKYPDAVLEGLDTITKSTIRYIEASTSTGVSGIFLAVSHATYDVLSEDEYKKFGIPYDLEVIEPAQDLWLNFLHLHGAELMFDLFINYPVDVINWHDRDTYPSISEGLTKYPGVVCGGLSRRNTMVLGSPESINREAADVIQTTGGMRFILGTGCVTPITTPHGNLISARSIVDEIPI